MKSFKKDIEEKNKALTENKKIFRDIFDQSAIGQAVADLSGIYLDMNKRFCDITGYSKKELIGKNLSEITHQDDIKKTLDVLRDLLLCKIPLGRLEKRYVRKDEKIIWGFLNITLFRDSDDNPQYFIGQVQDISELKEREQQLRDLKEKYSNIIENGNDGIVIIQDYLVKFSNSKMSKITGYDTKELKEKPFLSFIDPNYLNLIKDNYVKRLAGEKVEKNYKIEIIRKGDQKISVEISGSVIDYEGKPADMVFIKDITEREKAEEQERKRIAQIEKINKLAVDRELKMIELKKEIANLKNKISNQ